MVLVVNEVMGKSKQEISRFHCCFTAPWTTLWIYNEVNLSWLMLFWTDENFFSNKTNTLCWWVFLNLISGVNTRCWWVGVRCPPFWESFYIVMTVWNNIVVNCHNNLIMVWKVRVLFCSFRNMWNCHLNLFSQFILSDCIFELFWWGKTFVLSFFFSKSFCFYFACTFMWVCLCFFRPLVEKNLMSQNHLAEMLFQKNFQD